MIPQKIDFISFIIIQRKTRKVKEKRTAFSEDFRKHELKERDTKRIFLHILLSIPDKEVSLMCNHNHSKHPEIRDFGPKPLIFNIDHATNMTPNFRTTLWTGTHMQLTLMCIPIRGEIGVEMHADTDQFIRIESGFAKVFTGRCKNNLCEETIVDGNYAIIIPAGTWHNIVNIGNRPLKLYSLYAPPNHPFNTVHKTKECADHAELEK